MLLADHFTTSFKKDQMFIKKTLESITYNFKAILEQKCTNQCLIVLNSNVQNDLLSLVKISNHIILADGGANVFYHSIFRDSNKIKAIIGDFDSIHNEIKDYYKNKGFNVLHQKSQDNCDLEKAILKALQEKYHQIIALGALGNRLDHTFASLCCLEKFTKQNENLTIVLYGVDSIICRIVPGKNNIIIVSDAIDKKGAGMITFGKASVTTKGFEYNMGEGHEFSMIQWGNFISSSNSISQQEISITTDSPIYLILKLKS